MLIVKSSVVSEIHHLITQTIKDLKAGDLDSVIVNLKFIQELSDKANQNIVSGKLGGRFYALKVVNLEN